MAHVITKLESGTTSSLDAWMTNASIANYTAGATVRIVNSGVAFDLPAATPAYIIFLRVGP